MHLQFKAKIRVVWVGLVLLGTFFHLSAVTPMRFVPNMGQIADSEGNLRPDLLAWARGQNGDIFFRKDGFSYVLTAFGAGGLRDVEVESWQHRVDLTFLGSQPDADLEFLDQGTVTRNFYFGHCPDGVLDVPEYARMSQKALYPGVDLRFSSQGGQFKYDLVVAPGADLSQVRIRIDGADAISLDAEGSIVVQTSAGEIRESMPLAFVSPDGIQQGKPVACQFVLEGNVIRFEVTGDNAHEYLVIDPLSTWATYFGGSGIDYGRGVATNGSATYLAGETQSNNFPVTVGAQQATIGGNRDAYLARWAMDGNLQWATYLGGFALDAAEDLDLDAAGNIFVTGRTASGFPTTSGAYQAAHGGREEGFLAKFNPSGAREFATYVGGESDDQCRDVAVDLNGNVLVTGYTESNFQIASSGAVQTSRIGSSDAFVMKFSNVGVRQWGTYFGGSRLDEAEGIDTDSNGNVLITGRTYGNFPTGSSSGNTTWQNTLGGNFGDQDIFVVKLTPAGNARLWATYYGGTNIERGYMVVVDAGDNVIVTGNTAGNGFPTTFGTIQPFWAGGGSWGNGDACLLKFSPTGTRLWATYYGGNNYDQGQSVAVVGTDEIFMVGETASSNLPNQNSCQVGCSGIFCGFVVHVDGNGAVRRMASYIGGAGNFNSALDVAADNNENLFIAGYTTSTNFPVGGTNVFQSNSGGSADGFLGLYNSDSCSVQVLSAGDLGLRAVPQANSVLLRWEPGSENGLLSYAVERAESVDGFVEIGTVAVGKNDYQMHDFSAWENGRSELFYRLKLVGQNGEVSYSEIVRTVRPQEGDLVVFPVPVENEMTVVMAGGFAAGAKLSLRNSVGQIVLKAEVGGEEKVSFNTERLASGVYLLELVNNGHRTVKKLVLN